jgi:hypothetical protein
MDRFLEFLDDREPGWARQLRAAGPANTGGRGGAMPRVWRDLADQDPARFERLQNEFIHHTNYRPALQTVLEGTGVNVGELGPALQEVLWSTAVQHGPGGAARIFINALRSADPGAALDGAGGFGRELIEAVYDARKHGFSSSPNSIRQAVRARLNQEKHMALGLLERRGLNTSA